MKHLFFTQQEDKFCTYMINGHSCDGPGTNASAKVQAFTRERWYMEASFTWEKAATSDLNTRQNLTSTQASPLTPEKVTATKWKIEGKVVGTIGDTVLDITAKPDFLTGVTEVLSHLTYFLDTVNSSEPETKKEKKTNEVFSWKWSAPNITVYAERELKENPENNLVDTAYKYAIKLYPLFGIDAKVDVLQALINLATMCPVGRLASGALKFKDYVQDVLVETKSALSDKNTDVTFKAAIELDMGVMIMGELSVEKAFGGSDPKPEYIVDIKDSASCDTTENTSQPSTSITKNSAQIATEGRMLLTGYVKAETQQPVV